MRPTASFPVSNTKMIKESRLYPSCKRRISFFAPIDRWIIHCTTLKAPQVRYPSAAHLSERNLDDPTVSGREGKCILTSCYGYNRAPWATLHLPQKDLWTQKQTLHEESHGLKRAAGAFFFKKKRVIHVSTMHSFLFFFKITNQPTKILGLIHPLFYRSKGYIRPCWNIPADLVINS